MFRGDVIGEPKLHKTAQAHLQISQSAVGEFATVPE